MFSEAEQEASDPRDLDAKLEKVAHASIAAQEAANPK